MEPSIAIARTGVPSPPFILSGARIGANVLELELEDGRVEYVAFNLSGQEL